MKKRNFGFFLATSLLLCACNTGNNNSNNTQTSQNGNDNTSEIISNNVSSDDIDTPSIPSDTLFSQFDDVNAFDNKIRINGSEAPDPFIYRFNGVYYLTCTTNGKGIKGFKSTDLLDWEPVDNGVNREGYLYEYTYDGSSAPKSQTPFAPEVIYRDGKFYLVASPGGNGHYILESDSPEGPFTAITENIEHGIDGSFFIDKDESVYLYTSGLSVYKMEDDMTTFVENGGMSLSNCKIGAWNEGPYMIQRNGQYYFTYCGSHYLSKDYRVDYAYAKDSADIGKNSSYERQGTLVVSTDDDFNGLGHSCTILGPDMDSYYIVYHNLEGYNRYLNYSRLSFNGSKMVANDIKAEDSLGLDPCEFSAYDTSELANEGNYYFSPDKTDDTFTVEFNTIGEGEMIFSYIDDNDYSILEFKNNAITIYDCVNGVKTEKHKTQLIKTYSTDVIHTFRLQHNNGKVNLYFDTMEKESGLDLTFKGGKIGYAKNNTFSEIGYTACSNVALGSSDKKAFNGNTILANAYDDERSYLTNGSGLSLVEKGGDYVQVDSYNMLLKNQGDRATYRIYNDENDYQLNIRVPKDSIGKRIGVRLNNGDIKEFTITSETPKNKNGDVLVNLGIISITEGQNYLSIYCIDEVEFSELYLEEISYDDDIAEVFDSSFDASNYYVRNDLNLSSKGIHTDNQASCGLVSRASFYNVDLNVEFSIEEPPSGSIQILFNARNYSQHYSGDSDGGLNCNKTYQGYYVEFNGSKLMLKYMDYNFGSTIKSVNVDYNYHDNVAININVQGNKCLVTFNDEEVINVSFNIGNLSGAVGFLTSNCDAYITSLSATSNI